MNRATETHPYLEGDMKLFLMILIARDIVGPPSLYPALVNLSNAHGLENILDFPHRACSLQYMNVR